MVKKKARLYKRDYAMELLRIADGDLDSSRKLLASSPKRRENIFYLAEQAIEKTLKSALCALSQPIPFTHSLAELVTELPDTVGFPFSFDIDELSLFATTQRYEEGNVILSDTDAVEVQDIAQQILNWGESLVQKNVDPKFKL